MRAALIAVLLAAGASFAYAEEGDPNYVPDGTIVETDHNAAVAAMTKNLESDPALVDALTERLMKSRIGGAVSASDDEDKKRADIHAWIATDPGSAAGIAIGLAKDDAAGSHAYEDGLVKHMGRSFNRSTANTNRGAMGVLKGAAKNSKLMKLEQNKDQSEEERRELLKAMFEGKGAEGSKVITGEAPKSGASTGASTPAGAALASTFYDRLSAGNIRGYSPQLMSLQSALNTRRPPGAPALIETGKLDFATLSYPAYGLKYDLGNVEERLRRARIAELATMGGVRLTERDMKDPGLEARLLAKVPAGKLPKSFAARAAANARAADALSAFEAAAAKSKDPSQITKGLLVELSGRQREASRWLTAASLEEELARIESEEGFLTADLLASIDAVPADAPVRASYKRRGESYKERLGKLKANAQASLDALRSDAWLSRVGEIEKMMSESQSLRRNITRDISDYRLVPFRVAEAVFKQPRWRELLDDLLVRYAARTTYGREVSSRRGKLSRFLAIFGQIASGDLDGSHLSLVNAEGGRR